MAFGARPLQQPGSHSRANPNLCRLAADRSSKRSPGRRSPFARHLPENCSPIHERPGAALLVAARHTILGAHGRDSAYTSIAIGSDALPVVSYYAGALMVAHCGNVGCTAGNTLVAVDTSGDFGHFAYVTIGTDGMPAIAYVDFDNRNLKVTHCWKAFCVPYWRRRYPQASGSPGRRTPARDARRGSPSPARYASTWSRVGIPRTPGCSIENEAAAFAKRADSHASLVSVYRIR